MSDKWIYPIGHHHRHITYGHHSSQTKKINHCEWFPLWFTVDNDKNNTVIILQQYQVKV